MKMEADEQHNSPKGVCMCVCRPLEGDVLDLH